jgi:hypothetical protein
LARGGKIIDPSPSTSEPFESFTIISLNLLDEFLLLTAKDVDAAEVVLDEAGELSGIHVI